MTIGEKIKETRINMGLTQQGFADKLGLDEKSGYKVVSKWETDINKPSVETLKKISDLTQKSISWFTDNEELEVVNTKRSLIDEFLDRLIEQDIVKDINNLSNDVTNMILNVVKSDLQLRKLKKKGQ